MNAQMLYDYRETTQFCSGTDLHDFFLDQLGEPSPGGRKEVDTEAACQFVIERLNHMAKHNRSMTTWCEKTIHNFLTNAHSSSVAREIKAAIESKIEI